MKSKIVVTLLISLLTLKAQSQEQPIKLRKNAQKLEKDGNFKEALDIYQKLLLEKNDVHSADDLSHASECLSRLNREVEIDNLIENAIEKQPDNTTLLSRAGSIYTSIPHYGYIIAGEFKRGQHRGTGQYADSTERDRVRAIQLYLMALQKLPSDDQSKEKASYYSRLANAISMNRTGSSAWRLQILSDLTTLPDYQLGHAWQRRGRDPKGAPVNTDGTALFYQPATSWDTAKNDGERWRHALNQATKLNPKLTDTNLSNWANFLHSQFGVNTMSDYSWFASMDMKTQQGILQLHTLTDDETVARLATGIKRFALPNDQNFIAIYKELSPRDEHAADRLIQIYLNRRQHEKAVTLLGLIIDKFPKSKALKNREKLLQQIIGNWGHFSPSEGASPAGKEPNIDYVFRNAKRVTLVAKQINLNNLVNNIWQYIETNPPKLEWQKTQSQRLADSLVNGSHKKFVGQEVGRRTHTLKPRDHHWDTSATLSLPINKPGAYLISAELENGITSHTVVWLDATVIVRKDVKDGELFYVADAITGKPIEATKLEFFGYRWLHDKKPGEEKERNILTKRITKTTDADGSLLVKNDELSPEYQWMTRATSEKAIALLGFGHIRSSNHQPHIFSSQKSFGITDRPIYQPNQKIYGKFWIRLARYELDNVSTFAGKEFTITIRDATGSEVLNNFTARADKYGGVEYTYHIPEDAKLGSYSVELAIGKTRCGHHSFRVEEYKKPEYEVIVDAPKDPVMLGDKFQATIKANYYHGAPVSEATVKVKVLRHRHNDLWFPYGRWDWLYGGGYGWLDVERSWYPGWKKWGCPSPRPFWWHQAHEQPEIILEQDLKISPGGTAKIEIDTALTKALHSDTDHRYEVTAEVIDASRRSIIGKGSIIAAHQAYQVSVWLDRGYAHVGDPINATFAAHSANGKKVITKGTATLYQITSNNGNILEKKIEAWDFTTTDRNNGELKFQAGKAGQYRLAATLVDSMDRKIESGVIFTVRGDGEAEGGFQYSGIELIADKRIYSNNSTVKLLINTRRPDSSIILSLRGGTEHRLIHIKNQSTVVNIPVTQIDMPNFFIEAATVSNAKIHTAVREIIVPPEKRILNVEVLPSDQRFKPRAQGKVKLRVTDQQNKPVQGSLALTIYDKSLEYISGGSNVTNIKKHFWQWRRHFSGGFIHSLTHYEGSVTKDKEETMQTLGTFGQTLSDDPFGGGGERRKSSAPAAPSSSMVMESSVNHFGADSEGESNSAASTVMIRKDFADLVKWIGSVETNSEGIAEVPVTFPDNLTTWKIKTWAMAHGTRVGEGSAEVITSKDLIIRLQAPRFFIEKDQVSLSAIVHNYHKAEQNAMISLELEGGTLTATSPLTQNRSIPAGGETRIDWNTKVTGDGQAIIRMKVITQNDSDAMEMTYPVYAHGIVKQQAWSRLINPGKANTHINFKVPAERRPDQTRLEIRYSPTIAGSIINALPYLADYPYVCTEQTLNRFLPTVITQKLLREMDVNLEDVRNNRANLNPQEIGDDNQRMTQWKRWQRNPVFNEKEVDKMTLEGIKRLAEMQLSDGGWGWFSGWGERSYPHTTAIVIHGLIIAKSNGIEIPKGMLEKGISWLKNHETQETTRIRMWQKREKKTKQQASAMDAFVRLVLAEAEQPNVEMLDYLFRDKNEISIYGKSLTGMALHLAGLTERRDAVIRNIEQFLVHDDENQSTHLNLGNEAYWWRWYGSETEAHAWYLKLLAATNPKSKQARGIVKYLINNRKHATYWNSTRDTAYCIEAIADYMRASGEHNPDTEVTVILDGKEIKTVKITKENLFYYDNKVVIAGDALGTGDHNIKIKRKGDGPLYTNAYLSIFTKENFIKKTGLEIKVDRNFYKLKPIKATDHTPGTKGQVVDHKVEKYQRLPLKSGSALVSGDLVEVELHIHSKNDYEYIMFNDWKPAGLEALDLRSGYIPNSLNTYMEIHHQKTSFFIRRLPRGSHSLSYKLRAEIPGSFSALPTQAEAMYAPELKANSDEMKLRVTDKPDQ